MSWHAWRGFVLPVFLVLVTSGAILSACSSAPEVLSSILGPPIVPVKAQHAQRRPTYKPWEEFTMEYNMVSPEKTNWPDKLALLPKYDDNGDINWVKGLADKMIKPKPGLEDDAKDKDTEDIVVELVPKDQPDMKATFPHLPHTQILGCDNCHTEIFQMEGGADPITMDKINAGEYCGRCHGPVTFDGTNCARCHLGMGG